MNNLNWGHWDFKKTNNIQAKQNDQSTYLHEYYIGWTKLSFLFFHISVKMVLHNKSRV